MFHWYEFGLTVASSWSVTFFLLSMLFSSLYNLEESP